MLNSEMLYVMVVADGRGEESEEIYEAVKIIIIII